MATIGTSQPGTEGDLVSVDYDSSQGTGANSGITINGTKISGFSGTSGVRIFKTFPTISLASLPSSGVVGDGKLIEFTVNANSTGPVGISQFVFNIASTTLVQIATPSLYAYSDTGCSVPANGTSGGVVTLQSFSYTNTLHIATTTLATPLEVPAGGQLCFLLKTTSVTYTGSANTYNVSTTLLGDTTAPAAGVTSTSTLLTTAPSANFIWSPNATTTAVGVLGQGDWTNGAGLLGLPSIGLTQNRSN
jgi:hypothetical protein